MSSRLMPSLTNLRKSKKMELEDLLVQLFRVERVGERIVAFPDPKGKYRAKTAEDVERTLSEKNPSFGVEVKVGNRWYPVKETKRYHRRDLRRHY